MNILELLSAVSAAREKVAAAATDVGILTTDLAIAEARYARSDAMASNDLVAAWRDVRAASFALDTARDSLAQAIPALMAVHAAMRLPDATDDEIGAEIERMLKEQP